MSTRPRVCSASASRSADRKRRPRPTTSRAGRRRRIQFSRAVCSLRLTQAQGAVLDRVGIVLERTARTAQPASGDRRPRLEAVVLVEPHRTLSGAQLLSELVVTQVRGLAGIDALVETAQPPRRIREEVEALGLVRRIIVVRSACRGRVVRALPIASRKREPRRNQWVRFAHGIAAVRGHEERP